MTQIISDPQPLFRGRIPAIILSFIVIAFLAMLFDSQLKPKTTPVTQLDYGPYMAKLQKRIKHNWYPPKLGESDRTQVIFKVHRDGSVTDLRLVRPSVNTEADQAALKAVQSAAPVDPLPLGANTDSVDIQFTFDYNILNKNKPK
jgi:TonB family protein